MYLQEDKSWVDMIETFEFSHNIATSDTTGYSPFELLFGQPARTLSDLVTDVEIPSLSMREIADKREQQLKQARENVLKAQEKQAKQYNKHRKEVDIKVGDFVLAAHKALLDISERDKPINKAKALLAGPFRVIKETSYSTRRILLPLGSRAHDVINVDKMVKYIPSPDKFASRPPPIERSFDLDGEPLYTVESIIDHQMVKDKLTMLKVKWLNYPTSDASWVPVQQLKDSVPLLVEEYISLHPQCAGKPAAVSQAHQVDSSLPQQPNPRKRGASSTAQPARKQSDKPAPGPRSRTRRNHQ